MEKFYSTSDLFTASYLHTIGFQLIKTSLLDHKRLIFYFKWQDNIEEEAAKFLNGAAAPARRLFENFKMLRALTFERIRSEGSRDE